MEEPAIARAVRVDVVGTGPAGLCLGLDLLEGEEGERFDLHYWERHPEVRTTPCGEGLHVDRLKLLGGFDSRPFAGRVLAGAAVDAPGARRLLLDEPCATMRRSDWLPAIADRLESLGATFHLGRMLNEAHVRELPGDVVVGADGPSSRVARIVGNRRRFMPAAQVRIDATPELDDRLIFLWDPRYSKDYAWVFPRGDHTSVGTLAPASRRVFDEMVELGRRYGVEGKVLLEESYPIPYGGSGVAKGRYALLGDASGVANPMTKGGMGPSFLQARLLADALRDGGVPAYAAACARSPLFSDLPLQGLAALHRLRVADVQAIAGPAPGSVRLGPRATVRLALRTLATGRPGLWRDATIIIRALRHAARWGW